MEVDAVKRFGRVVLLLLLLINLALLSLFPSPSLAAGGRFELKNHEKYNRQQAGAVVSSEDEVVHERLLRANTRDYGRYDPTPTLSKPPFKLIPN
ncbi:unnamed protein product [Linum tenue]|uniref:Uncharacterized protein n=1 Tax=Linum tenue TaxID=586396 RepID=A0AAV0GXT5_9ROSI|nr:unnamed protein product [Linum tenue]